MNKEVRITLTLAAAGNGSGDPGFRVLVRDPSSGTVSREEWTQDDGNQHRTGGPYRARLVDMKRFHRTPGMWRESARRS